MDNKARPGVIGHNSQADSSYLPHADHDTRNRETGQMLVRALASEKAALDQRLGLREIRVLAALTYCMNPVEMRAWPSYLTISDLTGYSEDGIEDALTELVRCGYIFRERKQRAKGERACVHYGLRALTVADLDIVLTEAVRSLRFELEERARKKEMPVRAPSPLAQRIIGGELTRVDFNGWLPGDPGNSTRVTATDPGNSTRVASKDDPGTVRVNPGNFAGVTLTDPGDPTRVTPTDPGNFTPQYIYSNKDKKKSATEKADLSRPAIALPSRLKEIVFRGRAPNAIEAFHAEIDAALDRGITPAVVEGSLRSAVAWCESKGKTADADILKSCLTFIRGSKNPAEKTIAPDARHAREFYAANPQLLGSVHDGGWED